MKFLIIRFKMIGDVLLTSTVGRSLRESFPDAQIDYLTYINSSALFEQDPTFDTVFGLTDSQRQNPLKYLQAVWRISRNNYDVIIDAAGTSKSGFVSLFSPQAQFKISRFKRWRGISFTHRLKPVDLPINKIEERLAYLQPLRDSGLKISEVKLPKIALRKAEIHSMQKRLHKAGIDANKPLFAFAVGAREASKMWPLHRMQQVIRAVVEKYQAQIILLAGLEHERQLAKEVRAALSDIADIHADIETRSLRELASQISLCDVFIGNEGGPRHIAAAVGVPTVAVVSPSASKQEWLTPDTARHKAIEWRDIEPGAHTALGSVDDTDPQYASLYSLITAEHVMDLVTEVVETTLVHQPQSLR